MRKHLYVDGKDLADFGVYISGSGTFNAPEKEVTTYRVPGRNGLVLGADERLENIEVTYPCFIYTNFAQNMRDLRSYLLSRSGYVRIADDYDSTHFRMGFFEAGIGVDPNQMLTAGQFELTFNCQPQRWLTSGETEAQMTQPLYNPTIFEAKPLFRLNVTPGTALQLDLYELVPIPGGYQSILHVGIGILAANPYSTIYIDSSDMTVYGMSGSIKENAASYIQVIDVAEQTYGIDPPVIPASGGLSYDSTNSTIADTDVYVTPRWWET